ncbi:hypothetical protein CRC_02659 [Cylindrospermopsis raciborskii CS-505]|nr:hypothetical protein CRC_02659 [Cylindrospermopsis raciborskii CS-505]
METKQYPDSVNWDILPASLWEVELMETSTASSELK